MATTTRFLEFTINLTNKTLVDAQQIAHPQGIFISPDAAAAAFLAPIQRVGEAVVNPGLRSAWFITGSEFPTNVQSFDRKSGGWFGISLLFGNTIKYHWVGKFVYAGNATTTVDGAPAEIVAIAKRKYIIGFENGDTGAEMINASNGSQQVHRGASRHVDGMGYYLAGGGAEYIASSTQSGDAAAIKQWDRFYFKVVSDANATCRFWRIQLGGGAFRGASLQWTVDRRIQIVNKGDADADEVLITTSSTAFDLNRWYKCDVLTECKTPGGNMRLYIDGALLMTATPGGAAKGINNNSTISSGILGIGSAASTQTLRMYVDDWVGAEWPTPDSLGRFVGKDWINGSKIVQVAPNGTGTGNTWTNDVRQAQGQLNPPAVGLSGGNFMTSIVSGDAMRLTVADSAIKGVPGTLGVVCFRVAYFGRQLVAGQGTLGWKFDGLIDLAAQTTEATTNSWSGRWYRPTGANEPIANLFPFELHKIKAANISAAECYAFVVFMEHIGVFGSEDVKADDTEAVPNGPPRGIHGQHMSNYPQTPWAQSQLPPSSPVIIHTGTYTGNGTITELTFRAPVTWLMIRRVASLATGNLWWTTLMSIHDEGEQAPQPFFHALIDPDFVPSGVLDTQEQQTKVRIHGAINQLNAAAAAYSYVAFEDPGARYHINGVHHALSTAFATLPISLPGHSTFVPRFSFVQTEVQSTTSNSYDRYAKGIGHAANAASPMNAAENTVAWTHETGLMTADDLLMDAAVTDVKAWSAWRADDTSFDPNKLNVVAIGTYTGDGSASRTITFGSSGKRPVYCIVQPHNSTAAHHRDPSHTLLASTTMSTGATTNTGITAGGIDSFTVGVTLNTNAVVYEYFVLIGSATAGNGGWSIDGEFAVVDPDTPADGDWDDETLIDDPDGTPPDTDPDPDPGTSDEDDCLAGDVCVAATTREVNRALLEIGNTKFLTNYCTQDTLEAQAARLLYESSVRSVLHAFPWPFATKYELLTLAATQPSNQDWAFAYRQPIDCIFERRISVARQTGVDPTPPPFELSADSSGGLILTNEPAATLEYTCRPPCVAFVGDALFKEALKWHLAAALASPITRMPEKSPYCMEKYEGCIAKANAINRPDDPGLRVTPAWQATDPGAGAMAANVEVANLALIKIGANTIASLAPDQSREAASVNLIFEHELRATLRDYPWKFAKRYDDALVLVAGTDTVPVNADWQYSYRLPTDYVMVRRLPTTGTGRSFERHPKTWEVGTDATGGLLFTGVISDDLQIEYTARIANAVLYSDHLFREALGWRLAAALAPSLAQVDPETHEQFNRGPEHPPDNSQRVSHRPGKAQARAQAARWAFQMYLRAIEKARFQDANESEPEPHGEAEWIEGRS